MMSDDRRGEARERPRFAVHAPVLALDLLLAAVAVVIAIRSDFVLAGGAGVGALGAAVAAHTGVALISEDDQAARQMNTRQAFGRGLGLLLALAWFGCSVLLLAVLFMFSGIRGVL